MPNPTSEKLINSDINQSISRIEVTRLNKISDFSTPITAKARNYSNNASPKATDQFAPEFRYLVIGQHDAGHEALVKNGRGYNSNKAKNTVPKAKSDTIRHRMIINNINTDILAIIQSYESINTETIAIFDDIKAVFFLFNANNAQSFQDIQNYILEADLPANLQKVIAGTKIRDTNSSYESYSKKEYRELDKTLSQAEKFALKNQMQYLEIDATAMTADNLFTETTQEIADQMPIFQAKLQQAIENAITKVDNYISTRAANTDDYIGLFAQGYSRKRKLAAAEALKQTLLGTMSYMDLLASVHMGPLTQGTLHDDVYHCVLPILLSLNLIQLENYQLPETHGY